MDVHDDIKKKLLYFIKNKKMPHIVFHGPSGSGKRMILTYLLKNIYKGVEMQKNYIMYINCAHGKGIRFIRNELKFFAKTNIHTNNGVLFKSIILFNADKLTIDAQSALRRCIEQFSHTTRFFIVIDEYHKLLKPIVSRFCNIYIPLPLIDDGRQSFHSYNKESFCKRNASIVGDKKKWLTNKLESKTTCSSAQDIAIFTSKIYEKGYSALDIMDVIKDTCKIAMSKRYELLIHFDDIRREFRNEKLIILYILTLTFLRPNCNLENIQEM